MYNYEKNYNPNMEAAVDTTALNRHIAKVFGWTFAGLLTTAATVLFFIMGLAFAPDVFVPFVSQALNFMLFVAIGQIVLVFSFSRKIEVLKPSTAKVLYLLYAVSMGLLFTWVALAYDLHTIGVAFLLTSVSFGLMAIYGIVTKQDLTNWGNILKFALIGLIIAMVLNIFLANTMLDTLITIFGMFLFLGLTVYHANSIKHFYAYSVNEHGEEGTLTQNLAVFSALTLYMSFINLFLFILRFMRD